MKLYPALLAISAGLCLTTPISALVARLRFRQEIANRCSPYSDDALCDQIMASLATQSNWEYAFRDNAILGMALAALAMAPVVALVLWLPLKAIGAFWKRLTPRGNSARNRPAPSAPTTGNASR